MVMEDRYMGQEFKLGRGLDVGTGMLCEARAKESGEIVTKSVRDSFLEIKTPNKLVHSTMRRGLEKAGVNFFELDGMFYILGDDALTQSVERQVVVSRPMSKGVISPTEAQALPMFKALLKELLGEPLVKNEKIVFTIPAPPVDAAFDVIYHETVIHSILSDLGFSGKSLNEGQALIFSELSDEDYTGIAISFGSGMSNIAIANVADLVCKFSIAKGGDYIDFNTAVSLGFDPANPKQSPVTPNLVTYVKEQGVDIAHPDKTDKIKLGIAAHYQSLIRYVVENIVININNSKSVPRFMEPITVVVAGGTSLAPGFLDLFNEELDRQKASLPFRVKEVRHSSKPLTAVAEGCLLALLSDE